MTETYTAHNAHVRAYAEQIEQSIYALELHLSLLPYPSERYSEMDAIQRIQPGRWLAVLQMLAGDKIRELGL